MILSGPSGVGKGTLKARLMEEFRGHVHFSVSATTRAPRAGETEGEDYFFMSRDAFLRLMEADALLEHAEYNGNLYGTPRAAVEEVLMRGKDVILEIEVCGAKQVMKAMPEAVSVFILPPDPETLAARLRGRGTEDEETVRRRLERAALEIQEAKDYTYTVVNDEIGRAYEALRAIYLKHAGFMRGTCDKSQEEKPCR